MKNILILCNWLLIFLGTVYADDIKEINKPYVPKGINIPQVPLDPFKVKNFHSVVSDLQTINNTILLRQKRLQDDEFAVFHQSYEGDFTGVIINKNGQVLSLIKKNDNKKGVISSSFIISDRNIKILYKSYVKLYEVSLLKNYKSKESVIIPSVTFYLVSNKGVRLIVNTEEKSLLGSTMKCMYGLMHIKAKNKPTKKQTEYIENCIKDIEGNLNDETTKSLKNNPYKFVIYLNRSSGNGMRDEDYKEKISNININTQPKTP